MIQDQGSKSDELSQHTRPLRIGVLCNHEGLAAWQISCLSHVKQLEFAEVVLFIRNSKPDPRRTSAWRRIRAKLSSGLLLWRIYERMVVDRKCAASHPASIPECLANVPQIEVEPIKVGKFREAFSSDSVEALRKHHLDVLLRFGFGILTGEILDLPRYGVWSFHHGDPEKFRGAPPGFWEIHNGDPVTGVILQRLTEKLDGGVVLHAGWFKTNKASYPKSLDRILSGAAHFVARALTELCENPLDLMSRSPVQNSGPIYRYPQTRPMLTFLVRSWAAKIRNQLTAVFRHQQWSLGVSNKSAQEIFENLLGKKERVQNVTWLPQPPKVFLADPFSVEISGEAIIMAEEYDWKSGRGHISTVPYRGQSDRTPRVVIRSDRHLSYPYTFDYEDETYCAPECAESNGVTLYRLLRSERRWLEYNQIIKEFPAVDPTIFSHEGRWWLFCTSAQSGPNEFLYAWFANEPTGHWRPHRANPLKVDIRAARPAGRPFIYEGTLIRPAQDCSESYGGAITFNRVLKLTPEEFLEEPAGQLLPGADRPAGLHTISGLGDQTVLDGAQLKFVPEEFWRAVRNLSRRVV